MAYEAKHLQLATSGLTNTGNNQWVLNTTDASAAALAAEYISDGVTRGVAQGDVVWIKTRATLPSGDVTAVSMAYVSAVGTGADTLAVDLTAI